MLPCATAGCGTRAMAPRRSDASREQSARHRALLAGMLDPVVTIDSQGIIQEASDLVECCFGYAPAELVGQNANLLIAEPHHRLHDEYQDRDRRTGATNVLTRTREFDVVRKDGSRVVCELSVSRVDAPGEDG